MWSIVTSCRRSIERSSVRVKISQHWVPYVACSGLVLGPISRPETVHSGWPLQRPSFCGSRRARPNASTTTSARRYGWWCNKLISNADCFLSNAGCPREQKSWHFNFSWRPYREVTRGSGWLTEPRKRTKFEAPERAVRNVEWRSHQPSGSFHQSDGHFWPRICDPKRFKKPIPPTS